MTKNFLWYGSIVLLVSTFVVQAANVTWDGEGVELQAPFGPDDDWDNDDNWSGDAEPGVGDDVIILSAAPSAAVHLVLQLVEIKSINCKAPLRLDNTLKLTAASEFTDALTPDGEGAISSSAAVVFKGNNDARRVGFKGSGTFENQGILTLQDDAASAPLINNNIIVVLTNGVIRLANFLNNSTMLVGGDVTMTSSSSVTNTANIGVGGPLVSNFDGSMKQTAGVINVQSNSTFYLRGETSPTRAVTSSLRPGRRYDLRTPLVATFAINLTDYLPLMDVG